MKDKENKIYEIKNSSGKLSEITIVGVKNYNCSMLSSDDFSQYGQGSYLQKNMIIERIDNFIAKGGK